MDILEFTNDKHKKRYGELLQRHLLNGGKKFDRERFPMFYIFSAFDDIFSLADKLYSFEERRIKNPAALNRVEFDDGFVGKITIRAFANISINYL